MDICLRVLKESNKSRFDSYKVRNRVLIISHITFRDCRVHIFPTTFLEIAVCKNARYSRAIGLTWNMLTHYQIFRNRILAFSAGAKIARERRHPPFRPHIFKSFRDSLRNYDQKLDCWTIGLFSHDITTAMLVCHTLPVGVELFSCVKTFFFFPICVAAGHVGKTLYTKTL